MAGGGDLLLVIDVQQGFLNRHTEPVVGAVLGLLGRAKAAGVPLAFTRFVNTPGSAYERWIGWSGLMAEPGTLLAPPLELHAARGRVFVKHGYTAFTDAFAAYVRDQGVTRLFVCGVDTDCCVLKTAVDGFERGIEPVVLADACASHAGVEAHETGLRLLRRLIGGRQVRSGAASFPEVGPVPDQPPARAQGRLATTARLKVLVPLEGAVLVAGRVGGQGEREPGGSGPAVAGPDPP